MKKIYFIGEVSGNHENSLETTIKLMKGLKEIGASAVKFQTFNPNRMAPNLKNNDTIVKNINSPWNGKSLYEIYNKTQFPISWYKKIFSYGKKIKLDVFSSPFSVEDVDFLEKFNLKFYKVASLENTNQELLIRLAKTKKKIIISTGTASKNELRKSFQILKKNGAKDIVFLKCITEYPAKIEDYNLQTLNDIKKSFNCEVGLSDHTLGNILAVSSVHYGCKYIEKHICLKRKKKGIDSFYSTEIDEFKNLIKECNLAFKSIGKVNYGSTTAEKLSKKRRRILYFNFNMKKGEKISHNSLIGLRGGQGVNMNLKKNFIGKKLKIDVKVNFKFKKSFIS